MIRYHLSVLGLVLLCGACQETVETPEAIDYGYDYFPLRIGASWTYQVDSIIFDPGITGTDLDSSRHWVQERITDTFTDAAGLLRYRVEQYSRLADTMPWQINQVLTLARGERRAYRDEANLRFVKLPFPLRDGATWDGNAFFDNTLILEVAGEQLELFKSWDYRVLELEEALELSGLTFSDVATVQNADAENLLERRYALEQYARGVGLVYRTLLLADTQCQVCCNGDGAQCEPLPWRDKAERGLIVHQQLVSYQ